MKPVENFYYSKRLPEEAVALMKVLVYSYDAESVIRRDTQPQVIARRV